MRIEQAKRGDIDAIVEIIERRRLEYQNYQPTFWRKSADSAESTRDFFGQLAEDRETLFLVASENDLPCGFVIAREVDTPSVYAPGGATSLIDDFCVASPDLWRTVGEALLAAASERVKAQGAAQIVVVCGDRDVPKAEFLRRHGLTIASNWWTQPL